MLVCGRITKVTWESSFCSGFGWWWVRDGEAQEAAEIDSKNDVHNQGRWKLVLLTLMGFGQDGQCMWLVGGKTRWPSMELGEHGHSMWRARKKQPVQAVGPSKVCAWLRSSKNHASVWNSTPMKKPGSMLIKVLKVALSAGKFSYLCSA